MRRFIDNVLCLFGAFILSYGLIFNIVHYDRYALGRWNMPVPAGDMEKGTYADGSEIDPITLALWRSGNLEPYCVVLLSIVAVVLVLIAVRLWRGRARRG